MILGELLTHEGDYFLCARSSDFVRIHPLEELRDQLETTKQVSMCAGVSCQRYTPRLSGIPYWLAMCDAARERGIKKTPIIAHIYILIAKNAINSRV
jgi:hypothetical protein